MAGLTHSINFKRVSKELTDSRIKKLRMEGNNIIAGIHTRTLAGKDVSMRSFKKYSTSYAKHRASSGRSARVNLTYHGTMLGAMISKKAKNGLRFTFMAKSELDKATWNQKKRPFFGVDKNQKAYLNKILSKL